MAISATDQGSGVFWITNTSSGATVVKQFAVNCSSGSLLVAVGQCSSSLSLTFADDVNGAWTVLVSDSETSGLANKVYLAYFKNNASSGKPTVTATLSSGTVCALAIAEYTSVDTTSPADGSNAAHDGSGSGHTMTPGAITTTAAGVVIGATVYHPTANPTAGSGYTRQAVIAAGSLYGLAIEDKINAAGGSNTADWATSENYSVSIAGAFKQGTGGGGGGGSVVGSHFYRLVAGMDGA